MKIKIFFAILLTLIFSIAALPQTLDKAKLDQFFDRLAGKNKAMGSLVVAKDGKIVLGLLTIPAEVGDVSPGAAGMTGIATALGIVSAIGSAVFFRLVAWLRLRTFDSV